MDYDKLQRGIGKFTASVGSLVKVALMSKFGVSGRSGRREDSIVIMGNGPSLRQTIDNNLAWLESHELMAVNFFANTPDFSRLRPRYYILADGVFFSATNDANVKRLWESLRGVSWKITLFVPARSLHLVKALIIGSANMEIKTFKLTPVEG
ncbi:MAG: hypothetical protein K2M10_07555, partial [Muribaculaceae bacterium]|nr:hypothetical protein [Muribaculaceae bacterium]